MPPSPGVDTSSDGLEIILHSQVLFKNNQIYWHHLMQIHYTTYDVCRVQDSINPNADHQDIMLLSNTLHSAAHSFCYARVLGIFHANIIYNGPDLMDYQPHHLEFLWVCWFEVIEGHQKQNVYKLDILHFIPMDVDNAFGFVNPIDVLRSCHLIPDFSRGKLHPNCQVRLRACWDAHDAKQYYVNLFVFWLITWRWLVILITFIDLLIKTCLQASVGLGQVTNLRALKQRYFKMRSRRFLL